MKLLHQNALVIVAGVAAGLGVGVSLPRPETQKPAPAQSTVADEMARLQDAVRSLQYEALKLCATCSVKFEKECCEHYALEPKP